MQEADQQLFLRHPEEAAHLAKNFEKIASGIEQYIVEHHELPDGKGFPRKLTYNQIHPLSAVLHLADFVADLMMEYNFEMNTVAEKINEKKLYYLRGFYRKPFEAILRIFKINLK